MEKKRRILIPDGEDDLALRVLRCLGEISHFEVTVLSRDEWAPIRFSRNHRRFVTHGVNGFNLERVEVITKVAKQIQADIIFPAGLPCIRMAAEYKEELSNVASLPPLAPIGMLNRFADKVLFAELLEQEGIPYPKMIRVKGSTFKEEQCSRLQFPVLVKPRNLEAGSGILLCESPQQIVDYLDGQPDPQNFFVQEFMRGLDVGCSVVSEDGEILAYTIQKGIVSSHKPFSPPAAVEFIKHAGVLDIIKRLVSATRWSGVANFDLVLDAQTNAPWVLEANPRYWRSLLGSLVAGVNFPYVACLASEGCGMTPPEYQRVRYAKPEVALSMLFKNYFRGETPRLSLAESGLSYLLRDPLPDLAIQTRRLIRSCRGNKKFRGDKSGAFISGSRQQSAGSWQHDR